MKPGKLRRYSAGLRSHQHRKNGNSSPAQAKTTGYEADHLIASSAEIKNKWS
jgi:hypothetical protein